MHPKQTRRRAAWPQLIVAITVLIGLSLPALPARAVWNGDLDGNDHPHVGITYTEVTNPKGDLAGGLPDIASGDYCSGVLIASTLVLTAADCFNDPWDGPAYVSFATDYDPPDQVNGDPYAPGTFPEDYPGGKGCAEPCYRGQVILASQGTVGPDRFAVIRLEEAVVGVTPAVLPAFKSLGDIGGEELTTVGYGDFGDECDDDGCVFPFVRRSGDLAVDAVKAKELRVSAVDGQYPCFDAGGGNFLDTGSDEVLAALTNTFDCAEQTQVLRLDTVNARNFLCSAQFPELSGSALCGASAVASQAARADEAEQTADRQHNGKSKHKKGKQQRGKGKRGR